MHPGAPTGPEQPAPLEEPKSKTRRKKEMHALQDLGERLVRLSREQLDRLPLPDDLREAIHEARRINSHGARRRQLQYIGRLMRSVDAAPIRARLDEWSGASRAEAARLRLVGHWRERLLEDDSALGELAREYASADLQRIRALIRNARSEQAAGMPPRSSRALFKALRELVLGSGA
jgi:ribosome-associated protein